LKPTFWCSVKKCATIFQTSSWFYNLCFWVARRCYSSTFFSVSKVPEKDKKRV